MRRRAFLQGTAAWAGLALLPHPLGAAPLLFHGHGHGIAFSADGKALLAPTRSGLAAYEDNAWWEASGPAQGFSGFAATERAVYASSRSAGLLRSSDGGRTWQALDAQADLPLLAAGYRSGVLYGVNASGLSMSRDEGRTWQRLQGRGIVGEMHALAVHPRQAGIVAAGTDAGLYLSRDGGGRFARLERGTVTALAFDPDGEHLLYAGPLSGELRERALDRATRRSMRLPTLPGDYPTCLAESPTDARTLAFATRRRDVYLTRDGGGRWQRIATEGQALEG